MFIVILGIFTDKAIDCLELTVVCTVIHRQFIQHIFQPFIHFPLLFIIRIIRICVGKSHIAHFVFRRILKISFSGPSGILPFQIIAFIRNSRVLQSCRRNLTHHTVHILWRLIVDFDSFIAKFHPLTDLSPRLFNRICIHRFTVETDFSARIL